MLKERGGTGKLPVPPFLSAIFLRQMNPIPLLTSPLKGEEPLFPLPFRGRVRVGVG
ncbi:MAG: hypothetical protein NDI77_11155 [Geobacteraceae bacterium]|nr:hypothetical protein [Geobacteraceae bacterium]